MKEFPKGDFNAATQVALDVPLKTNTCRHRNTGCYGYFYIYYRNHMLLPPKRSYEHYFISSTTSLSDPQLRVLQR